MSIESLQDAYNGGDVPFPLITNDGFIHISKMIQKYLSVDTPNVSIEALEDYICFFDLSNFGNKEALVRYNGSLTELITCVGEAMNEQKETTPDNPYVLLISGACSAIIATKATDETYKLCLNEHVVVRMFSLIQLVLDDNDLGASDNPIFAELFVAVADSLSPAESSAQYVDFVLKILDGWEIATEDEDDDIRLTDEDRRRFEAEWQSGSPEMLAMVELIKSVSQEERIER